MSLDRLPALDPAIDLREALIVENGLTSDALAKLTDVVRRVTGGAPATTPLTPDRIAETLTTRHLIVPGCLNTSPIVEHFYFREQAFHDRLHPGPGGLVIRTLVAPTAARNVLFLGASDPAGQVAAIERLAQLIDRHGPVLPALHETQRTTVRPDRDPDQYPLAWLFEPLDGDRHRFTVNRFSQAALRYLYTADQDDGQRLIEIAQEMSRRDEPTDLRLGTIRQSDHYFSHRMVVYWQLVEPLPLFAEPLRQAVVEALFDHHHSSESAASLDRFRQQIGLPPDRHVMLTALNAWVEAEYFSRRLPDRGDWRTVIDVVTRYFESIWQMSKGGSGLIEGYASYLTVALEAALLMGRPDVIRQPPLRTWCQRLFGVIGNMGVMMPSQQTDPHRWASDALKIAAYFFDDGRFEYLCRTRVRAARLGVITDSDWPPSRLFPGPDPVLPAEYRDLKVMPLDEVFRKHYAPHADPDRAFDMIVGRGGFNFDDEYFIVQSVRSGFKYTPNVGALTGYQRHGYQLLADLSNGICPVHGQIRNVNTLGVIRDGAGCPVPTAAEIVDDRTLDGDRQITLRLPDYNGTDWYRTLHWRRGQFLLVRDLLHAKQAGQFRVTNYWNLTGAPVAAGFAAIFRHNGFNRDTVFFHAQCAGHDRAVPQFLQSIEPKGLWPSGAMSSLSPLGLPEGEARPCCLELDSLVSLAEGQMWSACTLFHATVENAVPQYRLQSASPDEARVNGETIRFAATPPNQGPGTTFAAAAEHGSSYRPHVAQTYPVAQPPDLLAWSSPILATATRDTIRVFADDRDQPSDIHLDSNVTALAVCDRSVAIAAADGTIALFDADGRRQWQRHLTILDQIKPYSWWVWQTPLATSLHLGPVGPDGETLLVAGSASCAIEAWDLRGELRWRQHFGWGSVALIQPAPDHPRAARGLLVGLRGLSCRGDADLIDSSGKTVATFQKAHPDETVRAGAEGWDITDAVFAEPFELEGRRCLLVGRSGAFCHATAYDYADQTPLWTTDFGRYITGCAIHQPSQQIAVGTEQGLLAACDCAGRRTWFHWLPAPVTAVAADRDGWLVGCDRQVIHVDAQGRCSAPLEKQLLLAAGNAAFVQTPRGLERWEF